MKRARQEEGKEESQGKRNKTCHHVKTRTIVPTPATEKWWKHQSHLLASAKTVLQCRDTTANILSYIVDDLSAFAHTFLPYDSDASVYADAICNVFPEVRKKHLHYHRLCFVLSAIGVSNGAVSRSDAFQLLMDDDLLPLSKFALEKDRDLSHSGYGDSYSFAEHVDTCLGYAVSYNQPKSTQFIRELLKNCVHLDLSDAIGYSCHNFYNLLDQCIVNLADKTFEILLHDESWSAHYLNGNLEVHTELFDMRESLTRRKLALIPSMTMLDPDQLTADIDSYMKMLTSYTRRIYQLNWFEWAQFMRHWIDFTMEHIQISGSPNYLLTRLQQWLFTELIGYLPIKEYSWVISNVVDNILSWSKQGQMWLQFLLHDDMAQQALLLISDNEWWFQVVINASMLFKPRQIKNKLLSRLLDWVLQHKSLPPLSNDDISTIALALMETFWSNGNPSPTTYIVLNALKQAGMDYESDMYKMRLCISSIEPTLHLYGTGRNLTCLYRASSFTIEQSRTLLDTAIKQCAGRDIQLHTESVALLDDLFEHAIDRRLRKQVLNAEFLTSSTTFLYGRSMTHPTSLQFWLIWLHQHHFLSELASVTLWNLILAILDYGALGCDVLCAEVLQEFILPHCANLDLSVDNLFGLSLAHVLEHKYYQSAHVMMNMKAGLFYSPMFDLRDTLEAAHRHGQWLILEKAFHVLHSKMSRSYKQYWIDVILETAHQFGNNSCIERFKKLGFQLSKAKQQKCRFYMPLM